MPGHGLQGDRARREAGAPLTASRIALGLMWFAQGIGRVDPKTEVALHARPSVGGACEYGATSGGNRHGVKFAATREYTLPEQDRPTADLRHRGPLGNGWWAQFNMDIVHALHAARWTRCRCARPGRARPRAAPDAADRVLHRIGDARPASTTPAPGAAPAPADPRARCGWPIQPGEDRHQHARGAHRPHPYARWSTATTVSNPSSDDAGEVRSGRRTLSSSSPAWAPECATSRSTTPEARRVGRSGGEPRRPHSSGPRRSSERPRRQRAGAGRGRRRPVEETVDNDPVCAVLRCRLLKARTRARRERRGAGIPASASVHAPRISGSPGSTTPPPAADRVRTAHYPGRRPRRPRPSPTRPLPPPSIAATPGASSVPYAHGPSASLRYLLSPRTAAVAAPTSVREAIVECRPSLVPAATNFSLPAFSVYLVVARSDLPAVRQQFSHLSTTHTIQSYSRESVTCKRAASSQPTVNADRISVIYYLPLTARHGQTHFGPTPTGAQVLC